MNQFTVPRLHEDPAAGSFALTYEEIERPIALADEVWVFLSGGPGESGIQVGRLEAVEQRLRTELPQEARIILLDQRGCGESAPSQHMRCAEIQWNENALVHPDAMFALLSNQARETVAGWPADLVPMMITPWQSARDLGALADHLGVERVNLFAHSYGTHLSFASLKACPDRIGELRLHGCEGPDQTLKWPHAFQTQLYRLQELWHDQFLSHLVEVLDTMDRRPVAVRGKNGEPLYVGGWGLRWMLTTWMGLRSRHAIVHDVVENMHAGDPSALERAVQGFQKMLARRPATYYLCDAASGISAQRWAGFLMDEVDTILGDAMNFPFPSIREAWGQIDLGDAYRLPPVADHVVQIYTGAEDCFTPSANVEELRKGLKNLSHHVGPGFHDDLLLEPRTEA